MIIKDGVFYGISEEWYESTFPQKEKIKVSLMIPETVTTIANDAFNQTTQMQKIIQVLNKI